MAKSTRKTIHTIGAALDLYFCFIILNIVSEPEIMTHTAIKLNTSMTTMPITPCPISHRGITGLAGQLVKYLCPINYISISNVAVVIEFINYPKLCWL